MTVFDGTYLEQMSRSRPITERDYVYLVACILPRVSHEDHLCPVEPMRYLIQEGRRRFPDSEILERLMMADGQGRVCESSEMHYRAKRYLEDHPL